MLVTDESEDQAREVLLGTTGSGPLGQQRVGRVHQDELAPLPPTDTLE